MEITRLVQSVLFGSQGGMLAKLFLLIRAQGLSDFILSHGQRVVSGLEGPQPDEIQLPKVLTESVLQKLPPYGRPVVIAASLLAAKNMNQSGANQAVEYLSKTQMSDGSSSEDIVATSLGILALVRAQVSGERIERAGRWLLSKQYVNGAWTAFDQLYIWSIGWTINVLMGFGQTPDESKWLLRAAKWLQADQNSDGSYGSTPPFTHPDLDDTAVALMGLRHFQGLNTNHTANLLQRLQNKDGSWSTFPSFKGVPPEIECEFPVYIPSLDVTIHVLEALWQRRSRSQDQATWRGLNWVLRQQSETGEFPVVWFEGPIYSTAQTLELLSKWGYSWGQWKTARQIYNAQRRAYEYLLIHQNFDGSWGSSVIETSLAVSALCYYGRYVPEEALAKGISKILSWQLADGSFQPSYQGMLKDGTMKKPLTTALTAIRALQRYQGLYKATS